MQNLDYLFKGLKGQVKKNAPLKHLSWFKIGGKADYIYFPQSIEDIIQLLENKPQDVKIYIIGAGSNLLFSEKGLKGIVLKLNYINNIKWCEDNTILAEAGALNNTVSNFALRNNLGGLEFLSGIPGSIGGGIAMNAGAFGREFKDVISDVIALDLKEVNLIKFKNPEELKLSYRHNPYKSKVIFLSCILKVNKVSYDIIKNNMESIKKSRVETQPQKVLTAGSTFANYIEKNGNIVKAWQLIDAVGLRGYQIGGASFSDQHSNFIINNGKASYLDVIHLIHEAKRRVWDKFSIKLRLELEIFD